MLLFSTKTWLFSYFPSQIFDCGSIQGLEGIVLSDSLFSGCSHSAQRWCYAAGCSLLQLRPVPTGPHCLCRLLYGPALCSCLPVDGGDEGWRGGWVLKIDSLPFSVFVPFLNLRLHSLLCVKTVQSINILSWRQTKLVDACPPWSLIPPVCTLGVPEATPEYSSAPCWSMTTSFFKATVVTCRFGRQLIIH